MSEDKQYSETNFPERLFVLGASPSLELLYPYREEMNEWGYWAIQRTDLVQPFLEFIDPSRHLYNISYWPENRNKGGRISLNGTTYIGDQIFFKPPPSPSKSKLKWRLPSSICAFISHFQKCGGKELFLFGYDGTNAGYWRKQSTPWIAPASRKNTHSNIEKDTKYMNEAFATIYTDWQALKIYHLGKTRNNFMTEISIEELMELK